MAEVVIVRECKHGQVRVLFGNITTVEGDIMVIPANNRLAGREGLDERMQLAAGPELRDFCTNIAKERRKENLQPCGVGEAVTSPGFNSSDPSVGTQISRLIYPIDLARLDKRPRSTS